MTSINARADAPTLSYSSGAFVGVQAVETRIAWTGSINKREFYSQIASVSSLIESILGRDFAREFVETVLLSQLTDSQALDIANILVKNLEWIKTLSEQKRIELVKKIAYYVKKGETAEEAIERIKKESEEYVKNVENEIIAFLQEIGDPELAKEIADLFECIRRNLPDWVDAAKWLLEVLRKVRSEKGNTGLKIAVEKGFKYSEGCAQASSVINELKEKGVEEAWEELNRIVNYPEGLKIKCILNKEGNRFRIYVTKKLLESYLGSEACWVRIDVKSRTLYKEYDPSTNYFNLPEDIGEDGEEVEVTLIKITTYDFIRNILDNANAPFDIAFRSGNYMLVVDEEDICETFLEEDLHYDKGNRGPAITFAIIDCGGRKHLIKLVLTSEGEYLVRIRPSEKPLESALTDFYRIAAIRYDAARRKLIVRYEYKGQILAHRIYLEDPKSVIERLVQEIVDKLNMGMKISDSEVTELTEKIGEEYTFLNIDDIKEEISKLTGLPKERLKTSGYMERGPDVQVYSEDKMVAIVEIKGTVLQDITDRMKEGIRQVEDRFKEGWNVKYGIVVVVQIQIEQTESSYTCTGIKLYKEIVPNSNYREDEE
ncbi:MAG: hypothetical protein QXR97_02190 [Thermoproteota archaeon]